MVSWRFKIYFLTAPCLEQWKRGSRQRQAVRFFDSRLTHLLTVLENVLSPDLERVILGKRHNMT